LASDLCDIIVVQLGLILLIKVDAIDGNHKISSYLVCSVNQSGGVIYMTWRLGLDACVLVQGQAVTLPNIFLLLVS